MMWMAAVPFFLLGTIGAAGAAVFAMAAILEAVDADMTGIRHSILNLMIWLVVAGGSFYIAARVVI